MREFLTSGLTLEPSTENLDLVAGYYIAAHDWHAWKKEELLTDVGFAGCLENELSPRTLAVMHSAEDWYTEAYQIGYGFGLAHALLSSPDIQMVEQLVSTKPQT